MALILGTGDSASAQVELVRTPHGGIQPQSAIDRDGTIQLVYFSGEAERGDVFHASRGTMTPGGPRRFE